MSRVQSMDGNGLPVVVLVVVACSFIALSAPLIGNDEVAVGTMERIAKNVPTAHRVSGSSSFLSPSFSGLDDDNELLLRFSPSELNLSGEHLALDGASPDVIVLLVQIADVTKKVASDAERAWMGSGLYQERVVKSDPEVEMIRVYPKSGYPMIWNYFRRSPEQDSMGRAADTEWVAGCRLRPGTTELSVRHAQCVSRFQWGDVQVELAFPGVLVQHHSDVREALVGLLESWASE